MRVKDILGCGVELGRSNGSKLSYSGGHGIEVVDEHGVVVELRAIEVDVLVVLDVYFDFYEGSILLTLGVDHGHELALLSSDAFQEGH